MPGTRRSAIWGLKMLKLFKFPGEVCGGSRRRFKQENVTIFNISPVFSRFLCEMCLNSCNVKDVKVAIFAALTFIDVKEFWEKFCWRGVSHAGSHRKKFNIINFSLVLSRFCTKDWRVLTGGFEQGKLYHL